MPASRFLFFFSFMLLGSERPSALHCYLRLLWLIPECGTPSLS